MQGYKEGQRVIAGAICPSFSSYACQDGFPSQDGGYTSQTAVVLAMAIKQRVVGVLVTSLMARKQNTC